MSLTKSSTFAALVLASTLVGALIGIQIKNRQDKQVPGPSCPEGNNVKARLAAANEQDRLCTDSKAELQTRVRELETRVETSDGQIRQCRKDLAEVRRDHNRSLRYASAARTNQTALQTATPDNNQGQQPITPDNPSVPQVSCAVCAETDNDLAAVEQRLQLAEQRAEGLSVRLGAEAKRKKFNHWLTLAGVGTGLALVASGIYIYADGRSIESSTDQRVDDGLVDRAARVEYERAAEKKKWGIGLTATGATIGAVLPVIDHFLHLGNDTISAAVNPIPAGAAVSVQGQY